MAIQLTTTTQHLQTFNNNSSNNSNWQSCNITIWHNNSSNNTTKQRKRFATKSTIEEVNKKNFKKSRKLLNSSGKIRIPFCQGLILTAKLSRRIQVNPIRKRTLTNSRTSWSPSCRPSRRRWRGSWCWRTSWIKLVTVTVLLHHSVHIRQLISTRRDTSNR